MKDMHAVMKSMRFAMFLTAGTIAACLVLMPMTTVIANSFGPIVVWSFLILPVASALTCLLLYCRLLVRMMGMESKTISSLAELVFRLKGVAQRANSDSLRRDLRNIIVQIPVKPCSTQHKAAATNHSPPSQRTEPTATSCSDV
jgi:hypothetical protein